jgi:hypothetical protein
MVLFPDTVRLYEHLADTFAASAATAGECAQLATTAGDVAGATRAHADQARDGAAHGRRTAGRLRVRACAEVVIADRRSGRDRLTDAGVLSDSREGEYWVLCGNGMRFLAHARDVALTGVDDRPVGHVSISIGLATRA